jgi:hypothetical protein
MIFQGMKEINDWMMVEYHSTWGYGYDFMLDAAQVIIDSDFKENTQRFAVAEIAGAEDQDLLTNNF